MKLHINGSEYCDAYRFDATTIEGRRYLGQFGFTDIQQVTWIQVTFSVIIPLGGTDKYTLVDGDNITPVEIVYPSRHGDQLVIGIRFLAP
jgi:hypothetical protein